MDAFSRDKAFASSASITVLRLNIPSLLDSMMRLPCTAACRLNIPIRPSSFQVILPEGDSPWRVMLRLKAEGVQMPAAAALFSPLTDLTGAGDSRISNDQRCAMFHGKGLDMVPSYYAPGIDADGLRNSLISPVYGSYSGFPPMLIHVGKDETLRDDSGPFGGTCTGGRRYRRLLDLEGCTTQCTIGSSPIRWFRKVGNRSSKPLDFSPAMRLRPLPQLPAFECGCTCLSSTISRGCRLPSAMLSPLTLYAAYRSTPFGGMFAERVKSLLTLTGSNRIVDLCSGSGGPVTIVEEELRKSGISPHITMTDLFPNPSAFLGAGTIEYWPDPVDARAVPAQLTGTRTMFASFHHFQPDDAARIAP